MVLVFALTLVQSAVAQVTLVRAGRLIDPDSGTVLANQVIMIRDGKIQAVGKELALPADAKWIDLSGKTVLPGLIDCHTHVADGQGDGEPFNVCGRRHGRSRWNRSRMHGQCCFQDLLRYVTWGPIGL